ncbi:MAG TPA: TIR domain-containing protein, partial [Mycobacteriales bacterium]|nr:TIR domain-containing protein [Mycobacteriales bacterium]
MADVFLSYAREDLSFVRQLTVALRARNREVWVDLEAMIPSARWREEIRTGVFQADAFVFVITPDSVTSEVCRTELGYATEASKRLVPILARQTPNGSVPSALAELHWLPFLDGTDFEVGVDQLVEVLDTDIDRVHLHTRLLIQAGEWEMRDHDRSLLLRGDELKQAETWSANQTGRKPASTPAQAQLILASRRAATRRQRGFGLTGVVVAVVMAILATVAFIQRQTAVAAQHTIIVRGMVAEADKIREHDPRGALQLGVAAYQLDPSPVTQASLMQTLVSSRYRRTLSGPNSSVDAVAFSPDGRTLASGNADNTVILWDLTDRSQPHRLGRVRTGDAGSVVSVLFSPDGRTLAATADGNVRLWDLGNRDRLQPLGQPLTGQSGERLYSLAFSADGRTLASGSGNTVILWDLT